MGIFLLWFSFLGADMCFAEEPVPANAQAESQAVLAEKPSADVAVKPSKNRKKGGKTGDKETEGTQARNRFEADTVIRSKYQLNGEQLEVDPD